MKKILLFAFIFMMIIWFFELNNIFFIKNNYNKDDKQIINQQKTNDKLYGSDKISLEYKNYLKIVQNYNLTWCNNYTWFKNETCKLTILSSLDKLNNINDCSTYKYPKIINECKKIVYNKNFLCKKLDNIEEKKKCLDNKYYNKALKEKKQYWCLYIENQWNKERCLQDLKKIKSLKNNTNTNLFCWISLLDKKCEDTDKKCLITQLFQKFNVIPSLKDKLKICEKIAKLDKNKSIECFDMYYKLKALMYMDEKICWNIYDKNIKYSCKQETIYKKAVENIKTNLCKKLDKTDKINQCLDEVIIRDITKRWLKDESLCKKMHTNEYKKNCYQVIIKNM